MRVTEYRDRKGAIAQPSGIAGVMSHGTPSDPARRGSRFSGCWISGPSVRPLRGGGGLDHFGPWLSGSKRSLEGIGCPASEADELDLLDLRVGIEKSSHLAHRDLRGAVHGVPVDSGADRGKGNRTDAVLCGEGERVAVAVGEVVVLSLAPAVPDGADGVDDEAGGKVVTTREAGLARRAADAWSDFGDLPAFFEQSRPGGPVDRAVHAPAAEHPLVGGVHDRVHLDVGDVGFDYGETVGHGWQNSHRLIYVPSERRKAKHDG